MELFLIFLGIFIIAFVLLIANVIILDGLMEEDPYYFFPSHIYKRTTLNKFGVALDSLFLFIINFGYCIVAMVNWLCHIGRKDS